MKAPLQDDGLFFATAKQRDAYYAALEQPEWKRPKAKIEESEPEPEIIKVPATVRRRNDVGVPLNLNYKNDYSKKPNHLDQVGGSKGKMLARMASGR